MRFEEIAFRPVVKLHPQSVFIGYADATLVVENALPGGNPLLLRIRGIEVKLTSMGPRVDFKSEKRADNGEWIPILFPKSAASRVALTEALLSHPAIAAVVHLTQQDWVSGRLVA